MVAGRRFGRRGDDEDGGVERQRRRQPAGVDRVGQPEATLHVAAPAHGARLRLALLVPALDDHLVADDPHRQLGGGEAVHRHAHLSTSPSTWRFVQS